MPIIGVWAATDTLVRRGGPPGRDNLFFYVIPLSDMLVFATLMYFAFRQRRNSPAHKRLIYIATSGLLIAAVARWTWGFVHRQAPHAAYVVYAFLAVLVLYDLWATHKVHRVTAWASAFLIFVYEIRLPIGRTAAWHSFAAWVQAIAS
jgi:FtsH-binding integral membrane protein